VPTTVPAAVRAVADQLLQALHRGHQPEQPEHEQQLSDKLQAAMRVYRLAFMAVVVVNVKTAEAKKYCKPIAYVLDSGTKHRGQVLETHGSMQRDYERAGWQVGPIRFESDTFLTALQAADFVAWTKRRLDSGLGLSEDFEPLRATSTSGLIATSPTLAGLPCVQNEIGSSVTPTGLDAAPVGVRYAGCRCPHRIRAVVPTDRHPSST
jgi:hypothetical protein